MDDTLGSESHEAMVGENEFVRNGCAPYGGPPISQDDFPWFQGGQIHDLLLKRLIFHSGKHDWGCRVVA